MPIVDNRNTGGGSGAVDSVNAMTGAVVITAASLGAATQADIDAKIIDSIADADTTHAPSRNAVFDALALKIATSTLDTDGTLAANSDAKIATQKAGKTYADSKVIDSIADADTTHAPSRNAVFDALALKADLASPALTGNPTAPNQTAGNNSTRIANTAYVDAGLALKQNPLGFTPEQERTELYNSVFIDFITLTEGGIVSSVLGGTLTSTNGGVDSTENNVIGAARLTTTAVNDRAGFFIGTGAGLGFMNLGSGTGTDFTMAFRWSPTTALPNGTDTTKFHCGLSDSATFNGTAEPVNFVGFRYDPTVNSGKFQAVNRNASVDTEAIDTGYTPVAGSYDTFMLNISPTGVAKFYINGTLVATSASTLPTPATVLGMGSKQLKTAGASTKASTFDWLSYKYSRATAR